jgi:hypothetical protein
MYSISFLPVRVAVWRQYPKAESQHLYTKSHHAIQANTMLKRIIFELFFFFLFFFLPPVIPIPAHHPNFAPLMIPHEVSRFKGYY